GLRATLGKGTPALPQAAETPYAIPQGDLGIPRYGETKVVNDLIKISYDNATATMAATVGKSAVLTVLARNAVTAAVELFNGLAASLVEDDYMRLYAAAGYAIEEARNAVAGLLARQSQPGGLQVYPSWFVGPIPPGAIRAPSPARAQPPNLPPPAAPVESDNQAVRGSESGILNRVEGATDLRTNGWAAAAYFKASGKPNAAKLLAHYLGNSGSPVELPASTVDSWTSESTTAYQKPVKTAIDSLQNEALQGAFSQARTSGRTITTSGNTRWITGVSGNSEDSVTTLGRYAVSGAYSITMSPDGEYSMSWRPDVSDYYNFSPQGDWGDIQHQTSSNMVKLYQLGYANEFLVTGSGSVRTSAGKL
ncbi:hypothetical protein, partial [Tsukamurella pseudospumae]|uniref:hypothetical protein n=1 Tax=Tsukamurella pseudospumae TaxID=239498 RepID=UPI000ACFFF29